MLTQSREDFLMDLKIRNEISRTNSFTFSNISSLNGSQSPVDQQLSKLVKFVQCQKNTIVRKELESLLPPLLCHLFIEMLKGKDWRPAHEFLRKYSPLVGTLQEIPHPRINGTDPNAVAPQQIIFSPHHNSLSNAQQRHPSTSKHQPPLLMQLHVDEQKLCIFRELISNLSSIRRLEDAKDNKFVVNFRSCKFKAQISQKTVAILNNFLSKHGHVLIIQILHVWFKMDLYELHEDTSSSSDYSDVVHRPNNKIDRFSDPHCDIPKDIKSSLNNRILHNDYEATSDIRGSVQDDTDDVIFGSNLKMKRLRECLHRVDNKYHKPIRIFNINYTENR